MKCNFLIEFVPLTIDNLWTAILNSLAFLLLFFIIKFVFIIVSFWWCIKFSEQNIKQSETETGDQKIASGTVSNEQIFYLRPSHMPVAQAIEIC